MCPDVLTILGMTVDLGVWICASRNQEVSTPMWTRKMLDCWAAGLLCFQVNCNGAGRSFLRDPLVWATCILKYGSADRNPKQSNAWKIQSEIAFFYTCVWQQLLAIGILITSFKMCRVHLIFNVFIKCSFFAAAFVTSCLYIAFRLRLFPQFPASCAFIVAALEPSDALFTEPTVIINLWLYEEWPRYNFQSPEERRNQRPQVASDMLYLGLD